MPTTHTTINSPDILIQFQFPKNNKPTPPITYNPYSPCNQPSLPITQSTPQSTNQTLTNQTRNPSRQILPPTPIILRALRMTRALAKISRSDSLGEVIGIVFHDP